MPELHERRALSISDDQLDSIAEKIAENVAEKAAVRAVELIKANLYQEAGKTFLSKFLQVLGIVLLGALYWLSKNDFIKLG